MYIGSKRGIISQFERYSLYLSFEPEVWAELAAQVKPTSYRRGEIIRPGGDTSARITIMLSGVAQVGTVLQSGRGSSPTSSGRELYGECPAPMPMMSPCPPAPPLPP